MAYFDELDPEVRKYMNQKYSLVNPEIEAEQKAAQDRLQSERDYLASQEIAQRAAYAGQDKSQDIANQFMAKRKEAETDILGGLKEKRQARNQAFQDKYMIDKANREQADFDPNSEKSRNMRKAFQAISPGIASQWGADFEKLSAADMPSLFDAAKFKETKDARIQAAQITAADKAAGRREKAEERALKGIELSATQGKQAGLYKSGLLAEKQYEDAVKNPDDYDPTAVGQIIDNSSWAPNWAKNDSAIKARAAKRAWVESFLRDASGAAIPEGERDSYAADFFPEPGDTPDVVENKRQLREQKMDNARIASGGKEFQPIEQVSTNFIEVMSPDGKLKKVPKEKLQMVLDAGGKLVNNNAGL